MRHLSPLVLVALVLPFCEVFSPALATDCTCSGTPVGMPFTGGDGNPLDWRYEEYFFKSGTEQSAPLVCYHKMVENKSGLDVRDVRWEVADFFRIIVKKGDQQASCPVIPGEMNAAPINGQLHFGPGSYSYETTVFQPKNGWDQTASAQNDENREPPHTVLAFDVIDAKGEPTPVVLTFLSEAKNGDDSSSISYYVENKSDTVLSVLVNLTASDSVLKSVPFIQRRMELPPGKGRYYNVDAKEQAVLKPGLIVIYDTKGQISAIDSAAFYTVVGSKERPDRSFWELLK
jgi:hypothetical protein